MKSVEQQSEGIQPQPDWRWQVNHAVGLGELSGRAIRDFNGLREKFEFNDQDFNGIVKKGIEIAAGLQNLLIEATPDDFKEAVTFLGVFSTDEKLKAGLKDSKTCDSLLVAIRKAAKDSPPILLAKEPFFRRDKDEKNPKFSETIGSFFNNLSGQGQLVTPEGVLISPQNQKTDERLHPFAAFITQDNAKQMQVAALLTGAIGMWISVRSISASLGTQIIDGLPRTTITPENLAIGAGVNLIEYWAIRSFLHYGSKWIDAQKQNPNNLALKYLTPAALSFILLAACYAYEGTSVWDGTKFIGVHQEFGKVVALLFAAILPDICAQVVGEAQNILKKA